MFWLVNKNKKNEDGHKCPPPPPQGLPTLPPRKDKTFPFYFETPILTFLLLPTPFISKKTPIAGYCLSSLWAAG